MNILAVDDEPLMLWQLTENLKRIFEIPEYQVSGFDEVDDVMEWLEKQEEGTLAYAFLDIKLRGMSGIELAKDIRERSPETKVIFCTAYSDYAMEAFAVHAVGYLLKPISEGDIRDVLRQLDQILTRPSKKAGVLVRVQTFGEFEVFVDEKPLVWEREKARELLAYLVDKRGAAVTTAEISLVLWEDDSKIRSVQTIISSLRKTLKKAGVADILIKSRNRTAVDVSRINCDLYNFIDGDVAAVNAYRGEYMSSYSWAEFTNGHLYHQSFRRFEDV